ncbi:RelE protein [Salmonella enterica]|nr:RelE protein [Salmonella enterica]
MGQKFFDMHESSRLNMSFKCSGAFNIIYIMRIRIAEGEKQPPSVNQSYNQRPDLADAMSIPIVKNPRVPASQLHGRKDQYKIKLRGAGYRLVYSVEDEIITVTVIGVGKRENDAVYKVTQHRS